MPRHMIVAGDYGFMLDVRVCPFVFSFWDNMKVNINGILTKFGMCINIVKIYLFVCVEVLRPCQPNGVMSSAVILPNHMFTGQA